MPGEQGALSALLPDALNAVTAYAATSSADDSLDYIKAKYDLSDHVYDVVTIDRLKQAVEAEGKSVIVFADINSDTAPAAIPSINAKAKELGIEKIYYFDPSPLEFLRVLPLKNKKQIALKYKLLRIFIDILQNHFGYVIL